MGSPMTLNALSERCADVAPEPNNHRCASGVAMESLNGQYSGARDHRDAQIGIDDLKSVLLQGLRTGVFGVLIREVLPTRPEERRTFTRWRLGVRIALNPRFFFFWGTKAKCGHYLNSVA